MALGFFGILTTSAQAAYFDTAPANRCDVEITRTLQTGSEGVEVVVLQNFLNRAGLLAATPNGHYGPSTTAAVRAFQYQNYIPAIGTVGPTTRNAINERMCDTNLDTYSYDTDYQYGYVTGVTRVDAYDPYVKVISPVTVNPQVYTNPQTVLTGSNYTTTNVVVSNGTVVPPVTSPATSAGIASTNVIYSPSIGYTYGITPAPGTLTITTPSPNATYREGDVVNMAWATSNISANGYTILLENTSTNQSRIVTTTTGNTVSFTLTKDVLDAVCGGTCTNPNYNTGYQGTFRFVVTTPLRDIAGNVSTFRAAVYPVTIIRPYANFGTVSITSSKTPVNNGELFKLYVNIPTGASWDATLYGQYSFKIRANCVAGVTTSIAGVQCGQDFAIPFAPTYFQSEIPAMVGNSTWYPQNVTFTLTVTNLQGQVLGTSDTVVRVNGSPFNW
ncbi:MAG: hypothetical protein RIQ41_367 [Candidatus Parcubacteria bacterium]